ncbi:hypothetical protein HA402_006706 [Bradysia odoriphaga]|nr:hypothetical protein HA402_006706 [Bradysia odoriphaga]
MDTSPGPDRVLVKTLRQMNISKSISSITNSMLSSSFVPNRFREGQLILIDKGDDVNEVTNWRPITIYSVIRRIIEKILDEKLRRQIQINRNQRGFVTGMPGCHINAKLINACLRKAKRLNENCVITFLDVSKAFDRVGHLHISEALKAQGISSNLHDLIMNLLTKNEVSIQTSEGKSKPINVQCGVPQGGPLSPILFNIAIDFIYKEICDSQFSNANGYQLSNEYDALCLTGFADDQAVSTKSKESATRSIDLVQDLFRKIGLEINPKKSQAIVIAKGKLVEDKIILSDGSEIMSIKADEKVKYLGCSFTSELIFDDSTIQKLNKNLNNLSTSPLLKPDQKLNIVNQYIFPTLIFPLQTAPINKIPSYVTEGLDVMIRRTTKEIIGLPMRTNDNLFYAPRRLRGLGLLKSSWEVHLQHFAIAKKLPNIDDCLFHEVYDCSNEMSNCITSLGVEGQTFTNEQINLSELMVPK